VSDQVDTDEWSFWVFASHNLLICAADLCLCAIMGHPHLSVTGAFSHLANLWLLSSWFISAGAFCVESSRADQWPGVFIGLVTLPTATIMRVDHKDLIISALDLTSLVFGVWDHLPIFNQAEETRMALVGNPELAIATTLAKGVVCIAALDRAGRGTGRRGASRVVSWGVRWGVGSWGVGWGVGSWGVGWSVGWGVGRGLS